MIIFSSEKMIIFKVRLLYPIIKRTHTMSQNIKVTSDHKPCVNLQGLSELGQRFIGHMSEVMELVETKKHHYICSIIPDRTLMGFVRLVWAYADNEYAKQATKFEKDDLKTVNFSNNLGSLIDYEDSIAAPVSVIFATLECIRSSKKYEEVIFVAPGGTDSKTMIFMK